MDAENLYYFVLAMPYLIQDFLFEGAFVELTLNQMINGYETTIADKINGGDFFFGADFALSSAVTPIFNDKTGTTS